MKTITAIVLACAAFGAQAGEQGQSELSNASQIVAGGSALVVGGSLSVLAGAGVAIVGSVEVVGESVVVVLEGASEASRATIRLSGEVARGAALSAGMSIGVVAVTSGTMLVAAGKVICFIPNEVGKALIYHARHGGERP
jgi:hypothetical protein